jgi:hypothetical protein
VLWQRVSRFIYNAFNEPRWPPGETPSEWVRFSIQAISSLSAPQGLVQFTHDWLFPNSEGLDEASRAWAQALFMRGADRGGQHSGSLAGLFQPFGEPAEGRVSFASDPAFLSAYPYSGDRGQKLVDSLFCLWVEPEPGPSSDLDVPDGMTRRERYEELVAPANCMACHKYVDPLGFSLERFDASGAYRELDNGVPIDTTGTYDADPDLGLGPFQFTGIADLAPQLSSSPLVARCVADKAFQYVMTQAYPNGVPAVFPEELDFVTCRFAESGHDGLALLEAIVDTPAFLLE